MDDGTIVGIWPAVLELFSSCQIPDLFLNTHNPICVNHWLCQQGFKETYRDKAKDTSVNLHSESTVLRQLVTVSYKQGNK